MSTGIHPAFAVGPLKPTPRASRARSVVNGEIRAESSVHDAYEIVQGVSRRVALQLRH